MAFCHLWLETAPELRHDGHQGEYREQCGGGKIRLFVPAMFATLAWMFARSALNPIKAAHSLCGAVEYVA
jgi:hypothetical protein